MAKIYIDPGHGGHDGGASSKGLVEKDWVLEVSLDLAKTLRQLGHEVKLSRTKDVFLTLAARSADANQWGADIFISVHFNAGGGYGWEDFIFNGNVSNNTKKLQNEIHEAVKPVLTKHGMRNRGKKTANFSVLRRTAAPAVLLEGGFVDTTDNAILRKSNYKKDIVRAVANGIQEYYGLSTVSSKGVAEWAKNATGWWYKNADGSYLKSEWKRIGGTWYYFNNRGYMVTGWVKVKEKWYYMSNSGAMQTGWVKVNNRWYYLEGNGAMVVGWRKIKNVWYYMNSSGAMQTRWNKINNSWYYMDNSGAMKTGLNKIGNNHFYFNDNGQMIENKNVTLKANEDGYLT